MLVSMTVRPLAAALSLLLVPGCYLVHGLDDDGGVRRDAAIEVRPDAGTEHRPDAGTDAATVGRDAGPNCAPPGTYDTALRVEGVEPPGCYSGLPSMVPIRIPPRVEDVLGMCDERAGTVVESAPCEWTIDVECLVPGAGTSARGVIDAHGGAVHGRLAVTQDNPWGECRGTVFLGE